MKDVETWANNQALAFKRQEQGLIEELARKRRAT